MNPIAHILEVLGAYGDAGVETADHILRCTTCEAADRVGKGYCATGEQLWTRQMELESKVVALLPELRARGIDVGGILSRTPNFKFLAKKTQ